MERLKTEKSGGKTEGWGKPGNLKRPISINCEQASNFKFQNEKTAQGEKPLARLNVALPTIQAGAGVRDDLVAADDGIGSRVLGAAAG
jgi:hypothetical protein